MMEYWISQYIDNELDLDEKIQFVEKIHADEPFSQETIDLIQQEKLLRSTAGMKIPSKDISADLSFKRKNGRHWIKPASFIISLAAASLLFFAISVFQNYQKSTIYTHRFVLHQPEAETVEIAGSFTNWDPVLMNKTGVQGYWEIVLKVTPNEHKFSYIINSDLIIADPTVFLSERDEFGSVNSIIKIHEI
ncbi:MAG: hypothetical protein HOD92_07290 [Deltaproteobacteria bacterium]|jgi:hypothetical protein|nr:hypothetical protein [Deltaproteobacteria bacterium]MBT4527944.1 hypothetical protein [Deltaproteobacteria bacterium]